MTDTAVGRHDQELTASADSPKRSAGFRADIQALRAVAVLAVVINHLRPDLVTGGYVGVDVFFVISGFLITSHLDRELVRTTRLRLGRFYARRIRRLLPAAFTVLLFSVVAAYFLLPYPRWEATATEAFASATYWENWALAAKSVDYSAANAAATLVQHYWSLSVEEQFYLCWPLLLMGLCLVRRRWVLVAGVAAVGVVSLAYCVVFTAQSPNEAYFVTPARVWEFALGGLVALAGTRFILPRMASNVVSLMGLTMIGAAVLLFSSETPFPGKAALVPTVGTALVIAAGMAPHRLWHNKVIEWRPVQFVGGISYSLYLWHWPLILLAPFALALEPGSHLLQAAVIMLSLLLAAASKTFIEDHGRRLPWGNGRTLVAMAAGIVAVTVAAACLNWTYGRHAAQAARDVATHAEGPCYGARAMIASNGCPAPFGPALQVNMGPANLFFRPDPECQGTDEFAIGKHRKTVVCDFSEGTNDPDVVWLVGDSHARQWHKPLTDIARERKWVLKTTSLNGCPVADVDFVGYRGSMSESGRQQCMDWARQVTDGIAREQPAMVFHSFFARRELVDDGSGRSVADQYRTGLENYWRKWTDTGAKVFVMVDPPLNGDIRSLDCVALKPADPMACAVDRTRAQPPDPLAMAAKSSPNPDVTAIDLTDYFCDTSRCYAVIGNVAVYYDKDHLNLEFSRSLREMIENRL